MASPKINDLRDSWLAEEGGIVHPGRGVCLYPERKSKALISKTAHFLPMAGGEKAAFFVLSSVSLTSLCI